MKAPNDIACAVLAAALATTALAAAAAENPPIRVLRIGHGDVATMKENIKMSVEGCRALKKLPPGPAKLPSDETIAKLAVFEEEELFDGALWAKYETQRSIWADVRGNCQLALFVHRSASVERSCESRVRGQNALIGELVAFEGPTPPPPSVEEDKLGRVACDAKPHPIDVQGLPTEPVAGTSCVWHADILGKMMSKIPAFAAKAKKAGKDKDAFDTCLYAARPNYAYEGQSRPVILRTHSGHKSLTGLDMSKVFGEIAATDLTATEFSDGTPIPKAKFTRATVESFVKQPTKTAIGVE
jgi:hypothetical protein